MDTRDKLKIELTVNDKVFPMHIKVGESIVKMNDDLVDVFAVLAREVISVRRFGTRYDNLDVEEMEEVEELYDKAQNGKED